MNKRPFFVICFFIVLTFVFTYPLILKIRSCIPGTYTTDESFAWLSYFWWIKYAFQHHLAEMYYSAIAFPFGIDLSKQILQPFCHFYIKWLSIFTGNVSSYNIQVLLSFILSGITMFYLAFALTKDKVASLFAGIIYSFCPYHFARAWQHLSLSQIQWMPLYILTLIKLREQPDNKRMFLSIIALSLVISFEFHYTYFMYIATAFFLLYCFISYKKSGKQYWGFLKMSLIVMIVGIIIIFSTSAGMFLKKAISQRKTTQPAVWGIVRPFDDLFAQSARPLSYLLPSTAHPVLGKFTEGFVGTSIYGESLTEHALYLGWIPLILAFIAFRRWKERRKPIRSGTVPCGNSPCSKDDFYIGFFVFLAIVAWLFSQPPWWEIGPLKIYMPSFFMYKILPMIRAYCRFGILVMLAIAVLAAFGLKFVLERFRAKKTKAAVASLFFIFVLFEFWNYPPFKIIEVGRVPQVYYWLKDEPSGIVIAEYPLDAGSPNELYKFYQATHEKKMINGTTPYSYANKVAKTIVKLSAQNSAGILKGMGVNYVLVHNESYLKTDLIEDKEELSMISNNPGLKLIRSFPAQECPREDIRCMQKTGPIDVYEVVAQPIKLGPEEK